MTMVDIIEKKKNGEELNVDEINYWITNYCADKIPDYQVSSLLMAICIRGMNAMETFYLTQAMLNSGKTLNLSSIHRSIYLSEYPSIYLSIYLFTYSYYVNLSASRAVHSMCFFLKKRMHPATTTRLKRITPGYPCLSSGIF